MFTKTITYTDFDNVERTETAYFNLTKSELLEISMKLPGTLLQDVADEEKITDEQRARRVLASLGNQGVTSFIKEIILKAYGKKSIDGRRFEKSEQMSTEFSQTLAFDQLYYELMVDSTKAAEFINNLIPESLIANSATSLSVVSDKE